MIENQNNELINLINILSFMIGMQNLNENRIQSAHNDVQVANHQQAEFLLQQINKKFEEQNLILEKQNKTLDKLLELLSKAER